MQAARAAWIGSHSPRWSTRGRDCRSDSGERKAIFDARFTRCNGRVLAVQRSAAQVAVAMLRVLGSVRARRRGVCGRTRRQGCAGTGATATGGRGRRARSGRASDHRSSRASAEREDGAALRGAGAPVDRLRGHQQRVGQDLSRSIAQRRSRRVVLLVSGPISSTSANHRIRASSSSWRRC